MSEDNQKLRPGGPPELRLFILEMSIHSTCRCNLGEIDLLEAVSFKSKTFLILRMWVARVGGGGVLTL